MRHPHYSEFRLTSEPRTADVEATFAARDLFSVPTGQEIDGGEQRLMLSRVHPTKRHGDEVVVRLMPWSDEPARPDGGVFDAIIAETTGRTVLSVSTPGVIYPGFYGEDFDPSAYRLSTEQYEAIRRGSLGRMGAATMRAALYDIGDRPFVLYGSSMAAATIAGAVAHLADENRTPAGVVISEGVNYVARNSALLAADFAVQQRFAEGYLSQNPDILRKHNESLGFWMRRVGASAVANYAIFGALAKGGFGADLGESGVLEGVPVHVVRGSISRLSTAEGQEAAVAALRRVGAEPSAETMSGHDHPATMTAEYIRRTLGEVIELPDVA